MKPFEQLTIKGQIRRLNNAATTCHDCGQKYGVYSVGCSSTWSGKCNVCGKNKRVTETRDYGYFYKTIRDLKSQLNSK